MARINARKKLSELYAKGCAVRFGPDGPRIANGPGRKFPDDEPLGEDEVEIWISPPNPYQREMALREAQAKRARALLKVKNDSDSEEQLTSRAFVAEMTLDTIIDYLLLMEQEERTNEAIRQVLGQPEWEDIDAYRDALRQFEEDEDLNEEDPEYVALMERDQQYTDQVGEAERELRLAKRSSFEILSRDDLESRVMERRGDIVGSQVFVTEYEAQMKFYSVRDPDDHNILFYDRPEDLAKEDQLIQTAVYEALQGFITEGNEAKNSQGAELGLL